VRLLVVLLLALAATPAAADAPSTTPRHLLAGVRAFKEGRYEDALVELRVVARAPDAPADLAFYLGPTLYKLGRYREALGVLVTSRAAPDALTDFYLGQTCFQLRLYRKARAVFAGLRTRGLGPALDEAAARYVDAVDLAYRRPPEPAVIDSYLGTGLGLAAAEPAIAAEYLDEARLAEALGAAPHRRDEIAAALGAAGNAAGRPRLVIDALEGAAAPEPRWQLARAWAAVGDAARARPLLEEAAKPGGPHAAAAAALLAKLPP
jgi:tetratricopeptide (TPR) repeat protein